MSDQNQEIEKISKKTERKVLKLWRKMTLLDRLYKIEEKKNHKFENDIDSIYSAEDTEDALIRSMNSPTEFWILDSVASFHLSSSKELFQNFK